MKLTTVCPCCSAALALTVSVRLEQVGPVPAASSGVPAPEGRVKGAPARPAAAHFKEGTGPYVCSTCNRPAVPTKAVCRKGENAGRRYQGLQCKTDGCPASGGRMLSGTFRWLSSAA